MRELKDVLKFSPKNDQEAVFKLVVNYIKSQRAKDEYLLCDKTHDGPWLYAQEMSTIYRSFWYSHLCGGGCYDHVLTFYLPTWEEPFVRISPGLSSKLRARNFNLVDPEAVELKTFVRQIFDITKQKQNRAWLANPLPKCAY